MSTQFERVTFDLLKQVTAVRKDMIRMLLTTASGSIISSDEIEKIINASCSFDVGSSRVETLPLYSMRNLNIAYFNRATPFLNQCKLCQSESEYYQHSSISMQQGNWILGRGLFGFYHDGNVLINYDAQCDLTVVNAVVIKTTRVTVKKDIDFHLVDEIINYQLCVYEPKETKPVTKRLELL